MKVELEYKDIIFMRDYLKEQTDGMTKILRDSYMDEKTTLEEIQSLGKSRDTLAKILSVIKQQLNSQYGDGE
jgi:hypothetical protein